MVDNDDIEYFRARAVAERALSETASDAAAALVHLKLAERYERLVSRQLVQPPAPSVASVQSL